MKIKSFEQFVNESKVNESTWDKTMGPKSAAEQLDKNEGPFTDHKLNAKEIKDWLKGIIKRTDLEDMPPKEWVKEFVKELKGKGLKGIKVSDLVNESRVNEYWEDVMSPTDAAKQLINDEGKNVDSDDVNGWLDVFAYQHNLEDAPDQNWLEEFVTALNSKGIRGVSVDDLSM